MRAIVAPPEVVMLLRFGARRLDCAPHRSMRRAFLATLLIFVSGETVFRWIVIQRSRGFVYARSASVIRACANLERFCPSFY